MVEDNLTIPTKRLVAATLVAVVLSGCSQTQHWLDAVRGLGSPAPGEQVVSGAPEADEYLSELSGLSSHDPALQAEIYADSQAAAINQRLTTVEAENRRLRQALAEAEDKLEAITSIERSIRQQDQ